MSLFQLLTLGMIAPCVHSHSYHYFIIFSHVTILLKTSQCFQIKIKIHFVYANLHFQYYHPLAHFSDFTKLTTSLHTQCFLPFFQQDRTKTVYFYQNNFLLGALSALTLHIIHVSLYMPYRTDHPTENIFHLLYSFI